MIYARQGLVGDARLAKKAFHPGTIQFPLFHVIHIKVREMIEFRTVMPRSRAAHRAYESEAIAEGTHRSGRTKRAAARSRPNAPRRAAGGRIRRGIRRGARDEERPEQRSGFYRCVFVGRDRSGSGLSLAAAHSASILASIEVPAVELDRPPVGYIHVRTFLCRCIEKDGKWSPRPRAHNAEQSFCP